MEVPETVAAALADRPVEGAVCLEAGAGAGNMTAALLEAGAARVYAVTDDPDHAATVRARFPDHRDRLVVLEGDLRAPPLAPDSVDLVTAHALVGVVAPADLAAVLAGVTRAARPGAHLVVDDYEPLPAASAVRRLFAVENAAAELAEGRAALHFYPAALVRRLAAGYGWRHDRTEELLAPLPWDEALVAEHLSVIEATAERLPEEVADALEALGAERGAAARGTEAGAMYSLALRLGVAEES